MSEVDIQFCCPECGHALMSSIDSLSCQKCSLEYPVKEAIPFFSRGDYYFADISKEDMDRLLYISQQQDWKVGVHDFLRNKSSSSYRIASDESRADWRFLFPLSRQSTVLDLGCGFGGISLSLAQRAGKVVAMDCSLNRLKLLHIRKAQENISNLFPVCGGDSLRLPFSDKYFDLVVLNGVLEWLGLFHQELKPQKVQLEHLKDIHRTLKDGGAVYIGIENRISYLNLLGAKDHGGLRFTALMPRVFADIYSKLRKKEGYRTYTYTLSGYKKLLGKAGFSRIEVYAAIPTYRDVYFLVKAEDSKTMEYFFKYLLHTPSLRRKIIRVFSRFLLKIRVFRFFIPEYGIVARK